MSKIRLVEGFNDRKNIQYYRDYEVKRKDFLEDETLSERQTQ